MTGRPVVAGRFQVIADPVEKLPKKNRGGFPRFFVLSYLHSASCCSVGLEWLVGE